MIVPSTNGRGNGRAAANQDQDQDQDEFQLPVSSLTQRTQSPQRTQRTQQPLVASVSSVSIQAQVVRAVQKSQPSSKAGFKKAIFRLARELKAIPELASADSHVIRPIIEQWHAHAATALGDELPPLEEVRIDLLRALPKVKYAAGTGPLDELLARARRRGVPNAAKQYQQPKLQLLVALCQELHVNAGGVPWPLSCREAGRLLDVSHQTAANWLFLLAQDDVLELVSVGTQIGLKASEYRFRTPDHRQWRDTKV